MGAESSPFGYAYGQSFAGPAPSVPTPPIERSLFRVDTSLTDELTPYIEVVWEDLRLDAVHGYMGNPTVTESYGRLDTHKPGYARTDPDFPAFLLDYSEPIGVEAFTDGPGPEQLGYYGSVDFARKGHNGAQYDGDLELAKEPLGRMLETRSPMANVAYGFMNDRAGQSGVGYAAYVFDRQNPGQISSMYGVPNSYLNRGTFGRPGVNSVVWTTAPHAYSPLQLANGAERIGPELSSAASYSPAGILAVRGIAVVIIN